MSSKSGFQVNLHWIPIRDSKRYPLKGIHPIFLQNIVELLLLVGFVWYLNWTSLPVVFCCMMEAIGLWGFSVIKGKSSLGFFEGQKNKIVWLTAMLCIALCALQGVVMFQNQSDKILAEAKVLLSNKEFLFCLLAIVMQNVIDFVKYNRMKTLFLLDLEYVFVTPVFKLILMQLFLLITLVVLVFIPSVPPLIQALSLTLVWSVSKLVLGQVQVIFKPS